MMKILTAPNPILRQEAKKIKRVDKKLLQFIEQLQSTLFHKKDPGGVGLAAPQVGKLWRLFATQLVATVAEEKKYLPTAIFINPVIIKHSQETSFGPNKKDPDLEGCLSIPKIYGPVPRWQWIDLEYQTIQAEQLLTQHAHYQDLNARIIQHELDHLNGILFTDYLLKYNLPAYQLEKGQLVEITNPDLFNIY